MNMATLEAFDDGRMQKDKIAEFFPEIFQLFSDNSYGKYVYIENIKTGYSFWSQEAVDYFGLPNAIMKDAGDIWTEHIAPQDKETFMKELSDVMEGRIAAFDLHYRAKNKEGRYVTCSGKGKLIRDGSGEPVFFAGTIINHEMGNNVDPVTGLYSRSHLMSTMRNYIINEKPFYIFMVGIRNFFDINSAYGYKFGNSVLKSIAEYAVNYKNFGTLFRAEGTKFAYIVDMESNSKEEFEAYYEELRVHFEKNMIVEGNHLTLDICGAMMTVSDFSIDINSIYNSALFVLQKAKEENAQKLVVVNADYFEGKERHLKMLSDIRNCISEGYKGFVLHYQPIVDAQTENITGMEALIRWQDRTGKLVPPGDFIPWLEQDPIYYDLGTWIMRRAIMDTRPLLQIQPGFTVNVNLAYPQLQRPEFKEMVEQILEQENFPVENIKLELTERCKLLDQDTLRNAMIYFKASGMQTALDDFGTGYSALNLMAELPVDQIKIDRSFVVGIETDLPKQSLLRAITGCARELGKNVCVEGIETSQMAAFIRAHFPVTNFQGYYFSKPLPIADFMDFYYSQSRRREAEQEREHVMKIMG